MKKIFRLFNIFLIVFSATFTLLAFQKHEGNIFIYLFFSILINSLLIYTINTKRLFFEIYFALFIWLGFWFKYTFSLVFLNGIIYDSGPISNSANIDEAIFASIIAISAVFISFILRNVFFKEKLYKINSKSYFEEKYLRNRKIIISLFILLFCLITIFNFNFSIYQKGFIFKHEIPLFIVNLTKWMLLFGFSTLSCFFIYTEILRLKKISLSLIIVAFFEIFLSYSSMLSRALIMNLSALTFSISKYLVLIKNKNYFFSIILILITSMFLINNYFSNHIRINFANEIGFELKNEEFIKDSLINNDNLKDNNTLQYKVSNDPKVQPDPVNMSAFIIINRWTGIDSMIAVTSYKNLSFDLLFKSFKEKKIINEKTFYETTFNVDYDGGKEVMQGKKRILKGNTLPGIISFLFYTGNYYFLFIAIFILTFLLCIFEIFCKKITNNNMIYASFISFMISFRLFNFGYAPNATYLFMISIFFSVSLIFLLSRFNFFFLNKNNNIQ